MEGKSIANYAISRVFLETGGEDELERVQGLEELNILYFDYDIFSNLLVIEPPVIPFSPCPNIEASEMSSNTLSPDLIKRIDALRPIEILLPGPTCSEKVNFSDEDFNKMRATFKSVIISLSVEYGPSSIADISRVSQVQIR